MPTRRPAAVLTRGDILLYGHPAGGVDASVWVWMRRLRALICVVWVAVAALFLPAGTVANHGSGYWFHQGYLPLADGTRQVFHGNVCCEAILETRMSWEVGSHSMRHVWIRSDNYGWEGEEVYYYDSRWSYSTALYVKAGCQNPNRFGYYAVWTNCRVGNVT